VCVIAVRIAEVPNDHVEPVSPVETVITPLRGRSRSITIERLQAQYPADDDNLWFIRANTALEVQKYPDGRPPFLIEGDSPHQRRETSQVDEAVGLILQWLDCD
jgi:hypothetical protein